MSAAMSFIDVHSHLFDEDFDKDIDDVVARAKQAGVLCSQVVAIAAGDCPKILDLNSRFPDFCAPGFGVHPVQHPEGAETRSVTHQDLEAVLPWIEKHNEKLVCVGEVGLDFTPRWCNTDEHKAVQRSVLAHQVALADTYDLPLNVHSRSAGKPAIQLLKEIGARNVLLHAFDGRPAVAMEGVALGYYFSIPPSIVRSQQRKLVERLPLDHLLLETDSPALGPIKDERNEPANISRSAEYIAQVKSVDVQTVVDLARQNSLKLFPRLAAYSQPQSHSA